MTKQDLMKALKEKSNGGDFVTRKEVAMVMNYKDPHNVSRYLVGLQRLPGKKYFIPDVAAAIMQEVEVR